MPNHNFKDITGKRFGRLTVVGREANDPRGLARWRCSCDCGGETITSGGKLRTNYTRSCGCLWTEEVPGANRTHGESDTRPHKIWMGMRQRCENANNPAFDHYGGRGIAVCGEWQAYEPFRDWALANGYQPHLTIDRIDNDKGYEPGNCRWATYAEQRMNQRRMK